MGLEERLGEEEKKYVLEETEKEVRKRKKELSFNNNISFETYHSLCKELQDTLSLEEGAPNLLTVEGWYGEKVISLKVLINLFMQRYFSSKCILNSERQRKALSEIIDDGAKLITDPRGWGYRKRYKILKANFAHSIEEILECSRLAIKGWRVLKKIGEGGWSELYLIISEDGNGLSPVRLLKVPFQKLNNQNVVHILKKFGYHFSYSDALYDDAFLFNSIDAVVLDGPLSKLSKEEGEISFEISSAFSGSLSENFNYKPVPQFFGSVEVKIRENMERRLFQTGYETRQSLIYEFIEGETLGDYFQRKRFSEEDILLLTQAAYALSYVHQRGFVHNDIKNDNFMVGLDGKVYLLDLAFSRLEDARSTIKGVRACTAPERVLGGVPGTPRSDQYSFGAMLYEILTGQKPINFGDTEGEKEKTALGVYQGEILPNFGLLREVAPPQLALIIQKCLAYNPNDRYSNMVEVEEELVNIVKHFPSPKKEIPF